MMHIHAHFRWLLPILVVAICLIGGNIAHAEEEDSYPTLESHNTVSHSVAAFTGAAGASIPIAVPPGRNAMQPTLALSYSSFMRNGWVGLGWNLHLGAIQRDPNHGLDYGDNDFLAGDTQLVAWTQWGGNAFRAKIEGEFNRYFFNSSTNSWQIQAKDGRVMFYGSTSNSRQSNAQGTFKWCLDRVEDPNGNYMTISYVHDQGQIYPEEIKYTGHSSAAPYHYVRFYLQDRSDCEISYLTHSQVTTAKRLKSIVVGNQDGLIRAYQLNYATSANTARSLLSNVRIFGNDASVDAAGTITGTGSIMAAELEYKDAASGDLFQKPFTYSTISGDYSSHKTLQLDANGDGAKDFALVRNNSGQIRIELIRAVPGTGFESSGVWTFNASNFLAGSFHTGDINGDGREDLVIVQSSLLIGSLSFYYALAQPNGDLSSLQRVAINVTGQSPNLPQASYMADVNGDGYSDMVFMPVQEKVLGDPAGCVDSICSGVNITTSWTCLSNGDGTFSQPIYFDGNDRLVGLNERSSRLFSDFNGDGKADLFLSKSLVILDVNGMPENFHTVEIAFGNGDGTFQDLMPVPLTQDPNPYTLDYDFQSIKFSEGDFNGDGLLDMVYAIDFSPLRLNLALSKGDGSFTIQTLNYGFELKGQLRAGDLNGDGKSDLMIYRQGVEDNEYARVGVLFSNGDGTFGPLQQWNDASGDYTYVFSMMGDYDGDGRTDLAFHHNAGGGSPRNIRQAPSVAGFEGRLHSIESTLGGITEFEYGPVGAFGEARLPYGMSVVTKVTVKEPVQNASVVSETRYAYRNGLHASAEREFRGFGEVVTTASNGCQSQTLYHQDEFRKGRAYELNTFGPGDFYGGQPGEAQGQVKTTWQNFFLDSAQQCAYVRIASTDTISIENGQPVITVTETLSYDGDGNLQRVTSTTSDPEVNPQRKVYSHNNYGPWLWRRTQERLEEQVNGSWQVVRRVDFGHDGDGNLIRKVSFNDQGNDVVETYAPDPYGNIETQTNGRGYSTHFLYDPVVHTYPVEVTNCAGQTITKQWDYAFGQPDWEEDPNQTMTDYTYDRFGRPTRVEVFDKNNARVALSLSQYFITNRPAYVKKRVLETMTGGNSYIDTWQYFDGLGRTIQSVHRSENGQPIVTRVYYDQSGRQYDSRGPYLSTWAESNPEAVLFAPPAASPHAWTQSFDDRNRPLVVNSRDTGRTLTTTYHYSGTSTTVTDPDLASKTTIQDALGRVKQVIEDPNGRAITTRYTYNAAGDLLQVRDALNNLTSMGYDTLGLKRSMNDPDMGSWSYRYDAAGNLTWQQDAKGQQIEFTFDCMARPTLKHYVNPVAGVDHDVTYTYDDPSVTLENHLGRLSRVTNGEVTTVYESYDALGQATLVTKTINGDPPRSTAYAYDFAGRPKHMVYPDGYEVSYAYHPGSGLLHTVTGLGADGVEVALATYTNYSVNGKIGTILFGNDVQTQYDYDPLSGRLSELLTMDGANANIVDRSYTYTPAGDIQTLTDASNPANVVTRQYSYDGLHRLRSESLLSGQDDYAYLKPTVMGYSYAPGSKPLHAVSAVDNLGGPQQEFIYDANGNLLSGPDMSDPASPAMRTISYNSDNMPVTINHSARGTTTFTYDAGGTRAKKSGPSGSTYYVGGHFEVNGGSGIKYIFAGSLRVAMISGGGQIYYFHQDHLGSSAVLTDSTGAKVQQTDYLPYGSQRGTSAISATHYGFTDQEKDPETGLYNYIARLYDPATAVFVTADSIVPNPFSTTGFHRYGYCGGNPLIYTDPSGHFFGIITTHLLFSEAIHQVSEVALDYLNDQGIISDSLSSVFSGINMGIYSSGSPNQSFKGGGIKGVFGWHTGSMFSYSDTYGWGGHIGGGAYGLYGSLAWQERGIAKGWRLTIGFGGQIYGMTAGYQATHYFDTGYNSADFIVGYNNGGISFGVFFNCNTGTFSGYGNASIGQLAGLSLETSKNQEENYRPQVVMHQYLLPGQLFTTAKQNPNDQVLGEHTLQMKMLDFLSIHPTSVVHDWWVNRWHPDPGGIEFVGSMFPSFFVANAIAGPKTNQFGW